MNPNPNPNTKPRPNRNPYPNTKPRPNPTGWDTIDGKICSGGFFTLWFYILSNSHVGVEMRIKMDRPKTQVLSKSPNKNPSKKIN